MAGMLEDHRSPTSHAQTARERGSQIKWFEGLRRQLLVAAIQWRLSARKV